MPHVESGVAVELALVTAVAVDGDHQAATGSLVAAFAEGVRIGVTGGKREAVIVARGQHGLQTVIVGVVDVPEIVNKSQPWILGVVRPGKLLVGGIWRTAENSEAVAE